MQAAFGGGKRQKEKVEPFPFSFFLFFGFLNLMAVRIENQAEPIPGYKLVERLGGGGFGEVWKAIAPGGLPKAIKFVYGDLQAASDDGVRAEQELKALSRVKTVRHPYILSLERYDIIDGQLIIVMELADRNLWDRFKECRAQGLPGIPREELLRYMLEASEALDLMNVDYQLQHLDIKPQNLFLVHNHLKVADFGLVKDLQGMMASVTGGITPVYAAPETFDGWISRFCDQYSLAIVYQELLTGQRPFNGTNVGQLIMQHLRSTPNLSSLPPGDREALGRALAKSPDDRFPRCQDFVRALWDAEGPESAPRRAATADSGQVSRLTPPNAPEETPSRSVAKTNEPDDSFTPKVNPAAAANARWIRVNELAEPKPEDQPALPVCASPVRPDGVLFPALVIGLGQAGLAVLQRLRESLHETFGSVEALPNIRWLYVDTDPEAQRLAGHAKLGGTLSTSEILQTRLNRPSHYLRGYSGRPRLESWFDLKMLYRIPRNPVTTGLRLLGRLAFFDYYRAISMRLNKELESCTRPEVLAKVAQLPGFGLRSLKPRVYVVASLAGGTGSGMFLDLAYVLRKLLKAQGHDSPDLVGLFFLPAVDRSPAPTMDVGNAFAALTELNHFSAPETTFVAHYDDNEPPVRDAEPPYNRCMLLPLPVGDDSGLLRSRAGLYADWLYYDLTTPLGRAAEECRAGIPVPSSKSWTFCCQTFGMYHISWPKSAFLRHIGRNLCQQLVREWMSKDAAPVREQVKTPVAELWSQLGLGGDQLLARLQKACTESFGQNPQDALAALLAPLAGLDTPGTDLTPAAQLVDQLECWLGDERARPVPSGREDSLHAQPPSLQEALDAAAQLLSSGLGKKLGLFVTGFIEQSGSRLAGAEEAVRQTVALIEQELQNHERLAKELATKAEEARERLKALLTNLLQGQAPKNRRAAASVGTLLELIRSYPRWRYQGLMCQRVANVYLGLRGQLSDQLREINYCRARLTELLKSFQEPPAQTPMEENGSSGRLLFPAGVKNVTEAAKQMLERITPTELRELDVLMQKLLQEQFQGLVNVCLASTNLLTSLEEALQREAEAFVGARLAGVNVADMYLAQYANEEEACADLDAAFEKATPELAGVRSSGEGEISILAAPAGPVSERFRELARRALPDVNLVAATVAQDIVFYREVPHLRLSDLEQLGPVGYEAYRQIVAQKNLTPHSRTDINEWRAAGG
jgi:eukaryotic-like serine/threonine-protein kinase